MVVFIFVRRFWVMQENNGYQFYLCEAELKHLIDALISWYATKYTKHFLYGDMSFEDLLSSLTQPEALFLQGVYRSSGEEINLGDGQHFEESFQVKVPFKRDINAYYKITANRKTGIVSENSQRNLGIEYNKNLTIEELAKEARIARPDLDFSNLEDLLRTHNKDLKLREAILLVVVNDLLCNRFSNSCTAFTIARLFANEMQKELGVCLDLKTMDKMINSAYNVESNVEHVDDDKTLNKCI